MTMVIVIVNRFIVYYLENIWVNLSFNITVAIIFYNMLHRYSYSVSILLPFIEIVKMHYWHRVKQGKFGHLSN